MPKMYYLSSCSTCKRIIGELGDQPELELIDIKTNPITEEQLGRQSRKTVQPPRP